MCGNRQPNAEWWTASVGEHLLYDKRKAVLISVITTHCQQCWQFTPMLTQNKNCHLCNVLSPGGRLDIKMSFQYRDPHDKDKTVSRPSYLYRGNPHIWERQSLYWNGGPAIPADYILEVVVIIQFPFTSYIIYFEYTFMAVDGLVTQGAMASVAMIASLLTVPN